MNHATVIHALKNYQAHKLHDKKIATLEGMFTFDSDLTIDEINKIKYLESKIQRLETQIIDIGSDNSLYTKIKNIPIDKEEYIMNKIDLWLKELEWKSKLKDSSTVYAGN